jgi:hypothetical protein
MRWKKKRKKARVPLATNAPDHWPEIALDFLEPGNWAKNMLALIVASTEAFETSGGVLKLADLNRALLLDEGILEIPIVVEDGGRDVPVFFYDEGGPEAAGHLAGAAAVLERLGEPPPVYYAPEALPEAPAGDPFRPFGADLLRKQEGDLPGVEYAMWWSTEEDPDFAKSPGVAHIDRTYAALDGIETYVLAAILHSLDLAGKETGRARLPDEEASIPLMGPEDRPLVLSASAEKGLRFHFPTETTPVSYRDRFWKHFADYAAEWRAGVEGRNLPKDPPHEVFGRPAEHWRAMRQFAERRPEEGVEKVGLLLPG